MMNVVEPLYGIIGILIVFIGLLLFVIINDHNDKDDDGGKAA